jgi:hypothetical protein
MAGGAALVPSPGADPCRQHTSSGWPNLAGCACGCRHARVGLLQPPRSRCAGIKGYQEILFAEGTPESVAQGAEKCGKPSFREAQRPEIPLFAGSSIPAETTQHAETGSSPGPASADSSPSPQQTFPKPLPNPIPLRTDVSIPVLHDMVYTPPSGSHCCDDVMGVFRPPPANLKRDPRYAPVWHRESRGFLD